MRDAVEPFFLKQMKRETHIANTFFIWVTRQNVSDNITHYAWAIWVSCCAEALRIVKRILLFPLLVGFNLTAKRTSQWYNTFLQASSGSRWTVFYMSTDVDFNLGFHRENEDHRGTIFFPDRWVGLEDGRQLRVLAGGGCCAFSPFLGCVVPVSRWAVSYGKRSWNVLHKHVFVPAEKIQRGGNVGRMLICGTTINCTDGYFYSALGIPGFKRERFRQKATKNAQIVEKKYVRQNSFFWIFLNIGFQFQRYVVLMGILTFLKMRLEFCCGF